MIMTDCIIAMKSRTLAEKAKRSAANENIRASIVSIDPSVTRRGCSVGLLLPCGDVGRMKWILDRRQIDYGDIIG